jgi:hypothetical protein
MLTKLEYESGLIKEKSTSELLRFTIRHILNQVHNQRNIWFFKNCRKLNIISNKSFIVKLFYHLLLPFLNSRYPIYLTQRICRLAKSFCHQLKPNSTNYTDNVSNDLLNFKDSIRFTKHYVK